jgi:hypothetical protein
MPHTPGPWEVHHWGDNEGDIHGSDGKVVCVMRDGATPQEEDWEGDARLIAAAPEMIAALRDAVDFINGHNECLSPATHGSDQEWIDYCVSLHKSCADVIAKAEGRE